MRAWFTSFLVGLTLLAPGVCSADESLDLDRAKHLLQTGDYDAAIDAYQTIVAAESAEPDADRTAVLGLSRAYQDRGLWDLAAQALEQGLQRSPNDAALLARGAELHFHRGEYEPASKSVTAALALEEDQLLARLVKAHLDVEQGRLEDAIDGYVWFVRFYNRRQPTDAESLLLVGEGSLQYARWKSVGSIFNFVVNTLCVDALADDPECWQASLMSGALLLEKYNTAQAQPEFEAALAVNPRAAPVIAAQGRAALLDHDVETAIEFAKQALTINPRLPSALRLAADASIASGELASAMRFIEQARQVNPVDQRTLARLAGVCLLDDGPPERDELQTLLEGRFDDLSADERQSRFAKTYRNVLSRNPNPGLFLADVGEILDGHRKYAAAELCYRRAIEVMPQLSSPRTALGMLAMRTGDLEEARSLLDAAFDADPYHVRVSNMRKVLGQLNEYVTVTSEHFVIRIPENQRLLGETMAEYLEQTYDELTERFGFEPPVRTQFEVFGSAKGTSAHQWFSARMVGLPWVQTIGASTGMIVAMASPNDAPKPFNWARVVRHEFVHILTLQQTRFNIPHWYTEALAVRTEGVTPPEWDTMLLRRVPAGDVFTLADINSGFQRPETPEDWQMAYCQSWLYAKFIAERFGEDAHAKLLDAFRRSLTVDEAISEASGVDVTAFESGYADYLNAYVDELRGTRVEPPPLVAAAQKKWRENPTDRDVQAELAWAMWNEDRQREAQDVAEKLLEDSPQQRFAVAIVAESMLQAGETATAKTLLESRFDAADPQPELLERLAQVYSAERNWEQARQLWQIAADRWPREPRFLKGLAASLLRLDDEAALGPVLVRLAALDADDSLSRKKLATLAHADEDWNAAIRWASAALQIDVTNQSMHRILAEAYDAVGEADSAARERGILKQLED